MTQPRIGLLIVISGPSGVGKDTVLRRLFELAPDLKYSVSYTTRPPRPGEVDGHSYTFVSEPEGLFIYITPPSTDELLNRLTGRNTESPEALAIRQKEALIELGLAKDYEHVVCNRNVDETAREILAMIAAEHARRRAAR